MNSFSRYRRRINLGILGLILFQGASLRAQTPSLQSHHPIRILVVGDSLSAEYGLKRESGWVALLKNTLSNTHPNTEIINASISGDTTSGGLARLKALLERTTPNIVLIELGANDALRGLPVGMTKNNLLAMVQLVKRSGASPIIAGMQIPPNYGREYTMAFKEIFESVAETENTALIPFFLAGIAEDPTFFQADTIHPNEKAQPILMENVRKILMPMLNQRTQP
jgi:acyl-CoA thioesterase-1